MKRVAVALLCAALLASLAVGQEKHLKMRLAVAPMDWSSFESWNVPAGFQTAIYEKLVKKLVDTGKFTVLEREALDALLKEQAIKEENTGQSQKGKITPAQALVQGKVSDFEVNERGGGGGVSVGGVRVGASASQAKVGINVRLFDVDTSEVLLTETATGTSAAGGFRIGANIGSAFTDFDAFQQSPLGKATTTAIDKAVEIIVKKLDKRPWTCKVADFDASSKEVAINAGSDSGVLVGDVFDVVRVTRVIKDPDTGNVIGTRTQKVGSLKVTSVDKKLSFCTIVDGATFEVGDIVSEPGK
ncbi:MAG: hypothetical protein JSS66_09955 [Armatimonadetes bacterium]|nr:hypothetical protein [Armatimonadota bacterium]